MRLSLKQIGYGLLCSSVLGHTSVLNVYQDTAVYTFVSQGGYLGFSDGVEASCKGNELLLKKQQVCPSQERLCQEFLAHQKTKHALVSTSEKLKMLDKLISFPKSGEFDPKLWIEGAKMIGEESAGLILEQEKLKTAFAMEEEAFSRQTQSANPLYLAQECQEEIKLTFPHGQINFSNFYEAEFLDENHIEVTQYLSILNHSGVDIKADRAMFYYRPAHRYINPIHFTPWIVSKYAPQVSKEYRTAMTKMTPMANGAMVPETMIADESASIEAAYEDARLYKVKNLSLPSLGTAVDVPVVSWTASAECKMHVYPYAGTMPYTLCAFEPAYQIDSNRWKIKSKEEIINDNAAGEYYEGAYRLYTKAEEDIQVLRRPIVQNEKNTGFFGGTARKKDGFILEITNKSDKPKTLMVTERIPVSSAEEIKVKLLSVTSGQGIEYKELKEGRIEIKLDLKANESKIIEVLFEISYDKELKINY